MVPSRSLCLVAVTAVFMLGAAPVDPAASVKGRPSLAQALASLQTPPAWYAATRVTYDTSNPWRLARLEIRKTLGKGDPDSLRQAIKMTCLYREKGDIGDGHEYPMYIYLGGEFAWAVREYEAFLDRLIQEDKPGFAHAALNLASCYRHFGEYDKAVAMVEESMRRRPKPPWDVSHVAHAHDMLGDLYADKGAPDPAREHYAKAAELFPTSRQPWGRDKLPLRAAKSRAKSRLLSLPVFTELGLTDGTYRGKSVGYVGPVTVTVRVEGGKVTKISLDHKENIPLGSERTIPRRIIESQSLAVDAVTAATTTGDAVRHGCLEALRQAGLE